MDTTILFPKDYFSPNNPSDNFKEEFSAAATTDGLCVALFNFDEFIEGAPLKLNSRPNDICKNLIYRGWMMKPQQYHRFYNELKEMGFEPLTNPLSYENLHCFPNVGTLLKNQTPKFLVFPPKNDNAHIDAKTVNATFDRFMFKDYVKSVKGTNLFRRLRRVS